VAKIVYITSMHAPSKAELVSLTVVLAAIVISAVSGGANWESALFTVAATVILTVGLYSVSRLLTRGARGRLRELVAGVAGDSIILSDNYKVVRGRLQLQDTIPPRFLFKPGKESFTSSRLELTPEPCSIAVDFSNVREFDLPAYLLDTRKGRIVIAYANPPPARPLPESLTMQVGEIIVIISLNSAEAGGLQGNVTVVPEADSHVTITLEKAGVRVVVYEGSGSGTIDYKPLQEPLILVGIEDDMARASRVAESLKTRIVACTGSYKLTVKVRKGLKSWSNYALVEVKPITLKEA
jgi:hypothetical protein